MPGSAGRSPIPVQRRTWVQPARRAGPRRRPHAGPGAHHHLDDHHDDAADHHDDDDDAAADDNDVHDHDVHDDHDDDDRAAAPGLGDVRVFFLGERRAAAVVAYLVEQGVDTARLTPAGCGKAFPIGDNATPEGQAENRRAELVAPDERKDC